MSRSKSGSVCAAKHCKNKQSSCDESFFRFPKDPIRARTWLIHCHREDLLKLEADKLHNSYRLCGVHFETKMFTNRFCDRLKPFAVPTLFSTLEGLPVHEDHTYSRPKVASLDEGPPAKKIFIIEDSVVVPAQDKAQSHVNNSDKIQSKLFCLLAQNHENNSDKTQSHEPLQVIPIDEGNHQQSAPAFHSSSTQTPSKLMYNTPRMAKYRNTIKTLNRANRVLRKQNKELRDQTTNLLENITLEQYQQLTKKFCPTEVATCINIQIKQFHKHPKG